MSDQTTKAEYPPGRTEIDAAWDCAEYHARRAEKAESEIERLRAVVDAARALRNFENTHNTADGDGFIKREELIMEITEAVCALDGEP